MSSSTKTVWAGGGVLWRRCSGRIQVALVHRPRYDDWSLPKGKAEPGELLVATAAREIVEETGYEVRMGRRLRTVEYRLNSGSGPLKKVGYWAVHAAGGAFAANDECDDLRWLDIDDASATVSYAADRKVLHTFASEPEAELHTMLLIRHAKAGSRARFSGDDKHRPLDAKGRRQATALTEVLGLFGAHELHAADRLRCMQTLLPHAEATRADITIETSLSEEAFLDDPGTALTRLQEIAAQEGPVRAVCSQGKVIPPLLNRWAARDGVTLPASRNRKGSVWVLTLRGDRLVAADHLPSPIAD